MVTNELTSSSVTSSRMRSVPQVRYVSLHGFNVQITAPSSLKRTLDIVLGSYPSAPEDCSVDIQVIAERDKTNRKLIHIKADGHSYPEASKNGRASVRVEWMVISELVRKWTRFVHVHAGLIATESQSVLLIGRSGAGKSTTTVAMAMEGMDLFSDDVALIDRETMRPWAVPRPIKLDLRSRRLLRQRGLTIPQGSRLGESIERAVLPGLPPIDLPGPPLTKAIFFANGRADQPSLRPLTRAEAVMRLVVQSASERMDFSGPTEGAMTIINSVDCYELQGGELAMTVELLKSQLLDHN